MGSVKHEDLSWSRRVAPRPKTLGLSAWIVGDNFSVGDFKGLIPPVGIAHKPEVLAMSTAAYWEAAAREDGQMSSYIGMLNHDGDIVDVQTLIDRGELSNRVVMRTAYTPHAIRPKVTTAVRAAYHKRIAMGDITSYIADAECIFRFGFPLGSSVFKNIAKAAGFGDKYELVATYSETVALLDEVRVVFAGDEEKRAAIMVVLKKAGLNHVPNPGYMIDYPVLNFDTKFHPAGDMPLTLEEVHRDTHLDALNFLAMQAMIKRGAMHQRDWCAARNVFDFDGKYELLIVAGFPMFADFTCTVDENRLMIRYQATPASPVFYIPANKEIQRAIFRAEGLYAAKECAILVHGDNWLAHMLEFTTEKIIRDTAEKSVYMMEQAICTIGNMLIGQDIFPAKPIESWVEPFLPYASIE